MSMHRYSKANLIAPLASLRTLLAKSKNLNDENQRLNRKDAKDLQSEANKKKLQAQQDGERENKERMQKLTDKMGEAFQRCCS